MNLRRAFAATAGGIGLVVGVLGVAVVAGVTLVALGIPDDVRAEDSQPVTAARPATPPGELVVGLTLADPALEAGVVKGRDVVLARGLEVEVARKLADRLGIRKVRFVAVRPATRLLANRGQWDIALTTIASPRVPAGIDVTMPYLATDQALLIRKGLKKPYSLAKLRTLQLCAQKRTDGAAAIAAVHPERPALSAASLDRLLQLVQTGACDVAAIDAIKAGRIVDGRQSLYGPVAARVLFGSGMVVVVSRSGAVDVASVDRAVHRLRANGTLSKLARFWLGIDPAALPVLR